MVSLMAGYNNAHTQSTSNEYPLTFLFTIEVEGDPVYITNMKSTLSGVVNHSGEPAVGIKHVTFPDIEPREHPTKLNPGSYKVEAGVWVPSGEPLRPNRLDHCEVSIAVQYNGEPKSPGKNNNWTQVCEGSRG